MNTRDEERLERFALAVTPAVVDHWLNYHPNRTNLTWGETQGVIARTVFSLAETLLREYDKHCPIPQ